MVCWEVNYVSVEFKARHKDVLEKALVELGWRFQWRNQDEVYVLGVGTVNLKNQVADIAEYNQKKLNTLKQQYSMQAVMEAAKKKKWFVKKKAERKLELRRY